MVASANNPPPPFRSPVVDGNGMLTDIWAAWFTSFFAGVNPVPSGLMTLYTSNVIPDGWLLCDGTALSRKNYSTLFNVVGTRFGAGDGSTTFNLPNPAGKYIRAGTSTEIGQSGGHETFTLTLENLPEVSLEVIDPGHTHIFDPDPHHHLITDPQHHHSFTGAPHHHSIPGGAVGTGGFITTGTAGSVDTSDTTAGGTIGDSPTGITINDANATGTNETSETGIAVNLLGQSTAVSLLPPYLNFVYIIKI